MSDSFQSVHRAMMWWNLLAVALCGFAIVTVNLWIYRAVAQFIDRHSEAYGRRPTISRAITDPSIGEPFEFWITVSGICLVIGVAILIIYYMRLGQRLETPKAYLWFCLTFVAPLLMLLQLSSSIGMHILSAFRFPDHAAMHMVGSYQFFGSQALVIVAFTVMNHAFLRDQDSLGQLHKAGVLHAGLVRARLWVGCLAFVLVLMYLGLFVAKDVWSSDIAPLLYWTYTVTEQAVISAFLLVLGLSLLDVLRAKPR